MFYSQYFIEFLELNKNRGTQFTRKKRDILRTKTVKALFIEKKNCWFEKRKIKEIIKILFF